MSKKIPFISCKNNSVPCDSCHFVEQRKLPFPNSISTLSSPFVILHINLWEPFSIISTLGHKYFLTLVDDYTRYTWIILLKTKDQTKANLIQFIAYIENRFQTSIKCLRPENGTEFVSMSSFVMSKVIVHQRTCVETPQ